MVPAEIVGHLALQVMKQSRARKNPGRSALSGFFRALRSVVEQFLIELDAHAAVCDHYRREHPAGEDFPTLV